MDDAKDLYLDLLKKCLLNLIYGEMEAAPVEPRRWLKRKLVAACRAGGMRLVWDKSFDAAARVQGRDWPTFAHTMVGLDALDNIQGCIEDILAKGVAGDFIETGVWRGGATIFMRAVLKAHGVTDRLVWVADSFEGLPRPDPLKYAADAGAVQYTYKQLAVSLDEVKANFEKYGLLDEQVRFLKGWFRETLPVAPVERLALIRLDGDMYEATIDALTSLYPKLSSGGYLIVDDYALKACRQAVQDYRAAHSIAEEIRQINHTAVYWQRS